MKKISLAQVNFAQGPTHIPSYYLPYSVGCIWAYANGHLDIQQNFELEHVLWKRESVESAAQKLSQSDVVGFSTYVWNYAWNNAVTERIRELRPDCFIFYGGPEPAITDPDMFHRIPWVNAVIKQEGELVFLDLLRNLDRPDQVPGLKLNCDLVSVDTGDAQRIGDLSSMPSPYLTGFFDQILQDNPGVEWSATLETNRGCPYQCTFCDWGSLTYTKVKQFPLQKVLDELTWMGQHQIAYLSLADANFGMFVERDNQIVDHFIDVQHQYGFPYAYTASYAKNQKKEILDIIGKLVHKSNQKNAGLLVSLQTLNETVLGNIRRKNLKINDCESIFRDAERKNIPVGTEIILGLPGETLASWKDNFWRLYNMNLHTGIDMYPCQLLENAEMNLTQRDIYGIKAKNNYDYFILDVDGIKETIQIVESTADMNSQDMLAAHTFNWQMQTLHISGFSNFYSRFLVANGQTTYEDFYAQLTQSLGQSDVWQHETHEFQDLYTTWINNGVIVDRDIHGVVMTGRSILFKTQIKLHADPDFKQQFHQLVDQHVQDHYQIDPAVFLDLQRLQTSYTIGAWEYKNYPQVLNLDHNIYQYIIGQQELAAVPTSLTLEYPENPVTSTTEYLEKLLFRRRRKFGRAWITINEN
jgi:tRNA A37 methylthiotransferase MiaB